jgi:hypothetical protein
MVEYIYTSSFDDMNHKTILPLASAIILATLVYNLRFSKRSQKFGSTPAKNLKNVRNFKIGKIGCGKKLLQPQNLSDSRI